MRSLVRLLTSLLLGGEFQSAKIGTKGQVIFA